jgi:hypothetical protein
LMMLMMRRGVTMFDTPSMSNNPSMISFHLT